MRSLSHLLSRANTPTDSTEVALVPAEGPSHFKSSPPSFMDIAERVGSDNEALRTLLTDIDLQFGAMENLKSAFGRVVEPLHNLADTLSAAKLENAKLRESVEGYRAIHDELSERYQTLNKQAVLLTDDNHRLAHDLKTAEQARNALHGDKAALSEQVATLCANLTTVEAELRERAAEVRELAGEKKALIERLSASDKRIIEVEVAGAIERERAALLESEKASLQASLAETLDRVSRMSRQISNYEKLLSDAGARVEELTRSSGLLEAERQTLSTACEEANHRREAEVQSLTSELNAARSRCAAAEKQCAELRQTIAVQAEERKATEAKLADTASALTKSEQRTLSLSTMVQEHEQKIAELEKSYSNSLESNRALSKTANMRETALEEARKKLQDLSHHVGLLKADAAANRDEAEKLIAHLKGEVERLEVERAITKGALETARGELGRLQRELANPQRLVRLETRDQVPANAESAG